MIQASLDVKGKFYVSEPISPDTPEWRVLVVSQAVRFYSHVICPV